MPKKRNSRRAIDNMDFPDERVYQLRNGTCSKGICKEETACRQFANNTYTCMCPHDKLPPTRDGKCPRNLVPVSSGSRGIIPNVQPPSVTTVSVHSTQSSTTAQQVTETNLDSFNSYIMLSITLTVIALSMALITLYCRRKLKLRSSNNAMASPINLKHSLLMADRYAPNPQYSACSATGVPLLRKETLKFFNEIGEGCFGKVYKGELMSENSEEPEVVAIKVLKENASREAEEDFIREVEIMSAFKHPNILSLLGMVIREGSISPMMVFEFMPHGDLAELLRSQKRSVYENQVPELDRKDLLSIALQIASGMKYLAAQRFVHRDLACRNCLVAEGPIVKIADFGMSRDVYTCDYYKIGGSRLLPVRWMSPESVLYGRFTLESDIWSYGVLLWEIYTFGKQPYYGHTNEEAVKLILDGIMLMPPEDCPALICELMKNCWKTEPRDRCRFGSVCDKLELAYETICYEQQIQQNQQESVVHYESEVAKTNTKNTMTLNRSLPRPPPLQLTQIAEQMIRCHGSDEDLLDSQGYLLANRVLEPVQYLQTLPDCS